MLIEKVGHIKNPLTVISIFAAIAETSGTTVLPFIDPDKQEIYIWFLMIFPISLVAAFFLTLNFNHRVLYAPSDYKNEQHFVNPYGVASPEEQGNKLQEEVQEIEEGSNNSGRAVEGEASSKSINESTQTTKTNFTRLRQVMADVTLTEKLAVNKLSKELGINFQTDVRVVLPSTGAAVIFDAFGEGDREVHAVEVKLFKTEHVDTHRLLKSIEQSEALSVDFAEHYDKKFILHVFVVVDNPSVKISNLENWLSVFIRQFKVTVKIHLTTLNDLQNQYQYSP